MIYLFFQDDPDYPETIEAVEAMDLAHALKQVELGPSDLYVSMDMIIDKLDLRTIAQEVDPKPQFLSPIKPGEHQFQIRTHKKFLKGLWIEDSITVQGEYPTLLDAMENLKHRNLSNYNECNFGDTNLEYSEILCFKYPQITPYLTLHFV